MEGHHHHLQQRQQQQQQQQLYGFQQIQAVESTIGAVADRFPQWSVQETRDFLQIRADLDQSFLETKRNKLLWEVVATKMKEKGYSRSAEQCKCKWKNLVTRYKGCETVEPEGMRQQFQFYNELQAIFTARMHRMLWMEAEAGGAGSSSKKKATVTLSSEDESDDQNEDSEGEKLLAAAANVNAPTARKRRKTKAGGGGAAALSSGGAGGVKEVLEEFMRQQMQMEMEWMKAFEAREEERRKREMEWRAKMEALEKERMMFDRMWREREEQRRIREEARAERRDALITALLEKLRREGNP